MLTNIVYHVYKTSYPLEQTNGLPKSIKKAKVLYPLKGTRKWEKYFRITYVSLDAWRIT